MFHHITPGNSEISFTVSLIITTLASESDTSNHILTKTVVSTRLSFPAPVFVSSVIDCVTGSRLPEHIFFSLFLNNFHYAITKLFALPSHLRGIKFCFLTMVLLAGFSWGLWGQGALECGSIVAPVPTVTDPDSLVYDRFGNAYYWRDLIIKEASVASSLNSPSGCNTGYFNLIFEPEVSTDMRAVANAVFCYLSEVIIQRTNVTPCGETWPQSEVDVHIQMQNLASNIAAQGTSFFSAPNPIHQFGMRHSRPFMIINGGTATQFGTEIYDAEIDITSNAAVTWNLDWNIPTPPNQYDLFTTILHEALHTLGFASLLSNNGVSIWDVNLFATPEFPATPTHQVLDPVNLQDVVTCGSNYWSKVIDFANEDFLYFLEYAANNCMNNLPDIVIGAAGIAPVSGSGGAGLSHLNSTCGGVNYVMDPQLPPGLAGTKRTITAPELEILCALGYQTTTCNGYYSIAHAEETNNMMGCCATPLIVCLNEPGSNIFSMDQLLCNDFSNLPQTVTDVKFIGSEVSSFPPLEISGSNIVVPNGVSPGIYGFKYTVTANSPDGICLMHDVQSTITVLDCSAYNCTPTEEPCDNLLCINDFENLPAGTSLGITTPVITFEGYSEFSTADIVTILETGNNVLQLGHGNSQEDQDLQGDTREAVTYQLADGIPPGCSLIVDLDVGLSISALNSTNFTLNFWGSTTAPCSTDGVITRINNACDVDNLCTNGSVFHPYCMGALTVTNILPWYPNNLNDIEHRTVIWENNTNETIQFLTLVSGTEEERGNFVIDNLDARIECRPVISCRLVNEEGICNEGISTLTWELCSGVGTTLTTNITLPAGVTAVDPNQLSQTIQIPEDGGCIEVSIDITTTIADGGHFLAVISGNATGICANMDFGCKEDIAVIDCEPDPCVTTCSLTTTELCSDQPTILTWRVCADGAVGSGTSTATVNITLPQGVTAVNPAQLTQTVQIPTGQCVEVSVEVTTTLTVGAPVLLSLTGVASGTCAEAAFGCEEKIMVIDCTPDPLCNCPSSQSMTITAAANGSLYSELEALHNYDQNDDGIISFSEHNGCIAISGQLIIDRDVKIEGANMLMAPCSEIFVNRQNTTEYPTLSLEFDHIQACTTMWKGITVGNNCRLEMYEGSIRDAEFAVRAPGASDMLEGPYSSIDIEDVVFIKNHVGIYMGRPGIKSWVSHGVLRNLTFIGNITGETLLPPCTTDLANYNAGQGYAGIVAQSLASLSVGPIAGTGSSNYFQHIRNGIICEGPALYAYRNSFENIGTFGGSWGINSANQPSFANSRGIAIVTTNRAAFIGNNRFNQCYHSIYGVNNMKVDARNNVINNGVVGMELFAPKGLTIIDNTDMTFTHHGIIARELSGASSSKYLIARNSSSESGVFPGSTTTVGGAYPAIWINNGVNTQLPAGSRISDNDFNNLFYAFMLIENTSNWTIDENSTNKFGPFGIRLSGSENNYLYHNTITNSPIFPAFDVIGSAGNRFCCNIAENTNQGIHFIGACGNTELRNTSFTKHTNPVFCEQGTAIGPQINYGNRFNQASGKATHLGSDGNILNSRFQVVDDLVPYYPESIYAPNQPIDDPWFIPEGTEKSCGNSHYTECQAPTPLPPVIPVNIKDLEKTIAEGGFYGDAYGDMLQWEGEQLLYAKLLEHADLLTADEAVNTFFSTHQNSKISAYQAVEAAIREIDAVPESLSASLQSLEEKIAAITDAITEAIKKAEEMEEGETSAEIKKKIALLIADRDLFIDDQQKMLDEIAQLRSIGVQSAWVLNESLVAESVLEQNRKTVNKVYLETLAQYNTTLTTAQVEQISDIAHQCLLEGGNAVLDARILYQLYEPETFNEEELCAATGARSRTDINHSSNLNDAILLIPNPANDYLRITGLSLVDGQQASIALLDVNGKRVTEHTLSADQAGIPTHTLPEGIYFCRIMVDHQLIAIRRVVILH